MTFDNKKLLTTSALALSCALAAPAAAQTAEPEAPATAEPAKGEERLVATGLADGKGRASGGSIRPFAGGILPNAGSIRSFAGPISGTAGSIRSFQGALTESAGSIRSFAGSIRSFAGSIRSFSDGVAYGTAPGGTFWGSLTPLSGSVGAQAGSIRSFSGDLETLAGSIRSFAGSIRSFDGKLLTYEQAPTAYDGIRDQMRTMVDKSRTTFGATVLAQTGQSFDTAFAAKMLGKYGVDLNNPASLYGLNEVGFELFLLDWHDNLMQYSGQDQVDGWMKQVKWNPGLTQSLGSVGRTKIGILDFGITGDDFSPLAGSAAIAGSAKTGIHGSAVAGLIAAKHDGRGVMGIAPNAQVFAFNPFDATNTAGWTDVKAGVRYLLGQGASVINMSLGVSGTVLHSGWNDSVFRGDATLQTMAKKAVFVLAAGNDGIVHSADNKVNWNFDTNPNIIIVGSVDPSNKISAFSNRPGEASFEKIAGNDPLGTDKLRDRFIVAPGEWTLVSDGAGGVTRMSGTSFAAPLVSGTIALVHDRWPWLADNPVDTVNLILGSTDDLGEAGTDPVYGRGMLNVEKALAPGNFFALKYTRYVDGVVKTGMTANTMLDINQTTINSWVVNDDVYFNAFEDVGDLKDSYRDFNIPVSTKLVGQTVGTTDEQFDAYVRGSFMTWMSANKRRTGFTTPHFSAEMGKIGGLHTEAVAVPRAYRPGLRQSSLPYDSGLALRSEDGGFAMRFGSGAGAGFIGQSGFAKQSDYDVTTGGANPFLGLASGSAYGQVQLAIGPRVTVSTGVTAQEAVLDFDRMSARERQVLGGLDPYRAAASNINVAYRATDKLTATIGYTLLNEDSALLGVRSLQAGDLAGGSNTDAATFGADYAVSNGLALSVSGTVGRTRAGGAAHGVAVSEGGLISSAWQVALAKEGLFDGNDHARVTFAQPLHIEHGSIDISMAAVVDRQTGEIGEITRTAALQSGQRTFVAEAVYGRNFLGGMGQVNLFGRANLQSDARQQAALTLGGSLRIGF